MQAARNYLSNVFICPVRQQCAVDGELRPLRLPSNSDAQEREQVPVDVMLPVFSRHSPHAAPPPTSSQVEAISGIPVVTVSPIANPHCTTAGARRQRLPA